MSSRTALRPLVAAAVIGLIGVFAATAQQPLLDASLASAVFAQVMTPHQPSGRFWNTLVGQLCGLAAGLAAAHAAGAVAAPPFTAGHALAWSRVAATAGALLVTGGLQLTLRATNPAGGATALLFALGDNPPEPKAALLLLTGIVLVAVLGEAGRRLVRDE